MNKIKYDTKIATGWLVAPARRWYRRSKQHLWTKFVVGNWRRSVCRTLYNDETVEPLSSDVKCKRCLKIEESRKGVENGKS